MRMHQMAWTFAGMLILSGCRLTEPRDLPQEGYIPELTQQPARSTQQLPPTARSAEGRLRTVEGTIRPTDYGYVLDEAHSNRTYFLRGRQLGRYAGDQVRITGYVGLESGRIDVRSVNPVQEAS